MSEIRDAALEPADSGRSVIPIRRADKKPYLEWKRFQERIATRDEIEAWFDWWPRANVAIVTSRISGLAVADADGPTGERAEPWTFSTCGRFSPAGR